MKVFLCLFFMTMLTSTLGSENSEHSRLSNRKRSIFSVVMRNMEENLNEDINDNNKDAKKFQPPTVPHLQNTFPTIHPKDDPNFKKSKDEMQAKHKKIIEFKVALPKQNFEQDFKRENEKVNVGAIDNSQKPVPENATKKVNENNTAENVDKSQSNEADPNKNDNENGETVMLETNSQQDDEDFDDEVDRKEIPSFCLVLCIIRSKSYSLIKAENTM